MPTINYKTAIFDSGTVSMGAGSTSSASVFMRQGWFSLPFDAVAVTGVTFNVRYRVNSWTDDTVTLELHLTTDSQVAPISPARQLVRNGITTGATWVEESVAAADFVTTPADWNRASGFPWTVNVHQTYANVMGGDGAFLEIDWVTVDVTYSVLRPGRPVLVLPPSHDTIDPAVGKTFEWSYVQAGAGTQQAVALRRSKSKTPATWASADRGISLPTNQRNDMAVSRDHRLCITIGSAASPTTLWLYEIARGATWYDYAPGPRRDGTHNLTYGGCNVDDDLVVLGRSFAAPWIEAYTLPDWTAVTPATAFTASATKIEFSPDGSQLAVGGTGPVLRVLNRSLANIVDLSSVLVLSGGVVALVWSPDGSKLVAVQSDNVADNIIVFDATNSFAIVDNATTGITGSTVMQAVFSPDGLWFAVSGRVFDTTTWDLAFNTEVSSPAGTGFTPDGRYLVIGGSFAGTRVTVWNVGTWTQVDLTGFTEPAGSNNIVRRIDFTDTQMVLATTGTPYFFVYDIADSEWWNGTSWVGTETYVANTVSTLAIGSGEWT